MEPEEHQKICNTTSECFVLSLTNPEMVSSESDDVLTTALILVVAGGKELPAFPRENRPRSYQPPGRIPGPF